MKKHRLFLSIIIFLLSGYSQLYAHIPNAEESHPQAKIFKRTEPSGHYNVISVIKKSHKMEVADIGEEEKEVFSSKRYTAKSDILTAIFFALAIGYFFFHVRKSLALYRHFSYYTSYRRYISFRVIII